MATLRPYDGPSFSALSSTSDIFESQRKHQEWLLGFSNVVFQQLREEIESFEAGLNPDEEVLALVASFGRAVEVLIDTITYRKPYLLIITGIAVDTGGKVQLLQHVSQTNLLFRAVPKPDPTRPARRIGFASAVPDPTTTDVEQP
jgi:hypothetical protein